MHNAPSVTYPVGRSLSAASVLGMLWLMGAVAVGTWSVMVALSGWRFWLAAVTVVGSAAHAAWQWWKTPIGSLSWDGENWHWTTASHAETAIGIPQVTVDLQCWLLMRSADSGTTRWLWLEQSGRFERWNDLRRAVYSRARPEALHRAQPFAATP